MIKFVSLEAFEPAEVYWKSQNSLSIKFKQLILFAEFFILHSRYTSTNQVQRYNHLILFIYEK